MDFQPITDDRKHSIEKMLIAAAEAQAAVQERKDELEELEAQIASLEQRSCTGSQHYRDKKTAKRPRLMVIHRKDQACPLHGIPEPGKRIRTYIGADPDRQKAALQAMRSHRRRQELIRNHDHLRRQFIAAYQQLYRFFGALGYEAMFGEGPPTKRQGWYPAPN